MVPEQSKDFETMWIAACARRLRERWPRLPLATLEEVAGELLRDGALQGMRPVEAAEVWLARASSNESKSSRRA